jgi:hypothetical protein
MKEPSFNKRDVHGRILKRNEGDGLKSSEFSSAVDSFASSLVFSLIIGPGDKPASERASLLMLGLCNRR